MFRPKLHAHFLAGKLELLHGLISLLIFLQFTNLQKVSMSLWWVWTKFLKNVDESNGFPFSVLRYSTL